LTFTQCGERPERLAEGRALAGCTPGAATNWLTV
jgi:hypothetical protein